jgi:hypothetical protein
MIHPATQLRFFSDMIGYGVFATAFIPAGTITYVEDQLEIVLSPDNLLRQDPSYKPILDKYTFIDNSGNHVLSWDFARFVNHCCHANTLSTGYGFEIAVRDIYPGEQITDEYALFGYEGEMELICDYADCRGRIRASDHATYSEQWDMLIKQALAAFNRVPQPLLPLLDPATHQAVQHYLATGEGYRSVADLTFGRP